MEIEFDKYGMRPMTEEEMAPILAHPKVVLLDRPHCEHEGTYYPVRAGRHISVNDILKDFDEYSVVYLFPQGLKYQRGYEGRPEDGPEFANPCPPMYWTRTKKIK